MAIRPDATPLLGRPAYRWEREDVPDGIRRTVLVLAEHDTTLHDTVGLFEQEGFAVQMASGENDVATWIRTLKPALVAYRLTDPATKRTVCRNTLQMVAALPGARVPTLALCELGEATAAASLCKEGLADDYLIVPHLKDDVDRLSTVATRLIELGRQRENAARCADAVDRVWESFLHFDAELRDELQKFDSSGRIAQSLATTRTAHHRLRSRVNGLPVLVIDDDPNFQEMLTTLVAALNQPVVAATDASEAMRWLENNEPALILLDYQMPGQDGVSVLTWIRQSRRLASVPVMMLTGHSRLDTVRRARSLGVAEFIVKPCEPLTIMQKVAAYL